MDLRNWYIQNEDLSNRNLCVTILFILHKHKTLAPDLAMTLTDFGFGYILDSTGQFMADNRIPTDRRFHTFLLDKENRVVLVGSPIGNPKMWELYKSTIARLAAHGGTLPDEQTKMPLGQ